MDDKHRETTDAEGQVYCKTYIPKLAGTYKGACAIVGGGKLMWEDWKKFKELFFDIDIICVNVAGMFIPHPVKHLFSWHWKQIAFIKGFRKAEIPDDESLTHSVRQFEGRINHVWYMSGGTSVSGLSAIHFAWLLGYDKYILIGCPMDNSGYFYKPSINDTFFDKPRHDEVNNMKKRYGERIKSFSGHTKEVFGEPTKEWLGENHDTTI